VALDTTPPPYAVANTKTRNLRPTIGHARWKLSSAPCAECHGTNGAGREQSGSEAGAINAPAFLALISDQALRRIIITGRPDLGMPSYAENHGRPKDYRPLSSAEINDLVALLAQLRAEGHLAVAERH